MKMRNQFPSFKRLSVVIASTTAIALNLFAYPTLAGDPFRKTNTHNIGNKTEAAFKEIFEQGNYPQAKIYLQQAEATEGNDPLVYAMRGSLAYMEQDREGLKSYADKTLQKAQQLNSTDPLRGNLYTAVGNFLKGSYSFETEGALGAVGKLQQVFQYVDEAKKIAPDDPELNLIKGYMELMLSVNLPFSDPSQAINELQKQAQPKYLVDRGIALGYRDLKQYSKAQPFINSAVAQTPNNPEVHYLKAQILVGLGKKQEAKEAFNKALTKPTQLPKMLVAQIFYENCKNERNLDNKDRDCRALRNKIRAEAGSWGPSKLPALD